MRLRHSLLASALLLAISAHVAAAATGFSATINGAQVAPPGSISTATGSGTCILNNAGTQLSFAITYSGLITNSTAAHFHGPGLPGVNAGVVFNLASFGTLGATSGAFNGVWNIDATNLARLNAGSLYINIHTSTYPGGEIRGQVVSNPTPNKATSWGRIKSLYR